MALKLWYRFKEKVERCVWGKILKRRSRSHFGLMVCSQCNHVGTYHIALIRKRKRKREREGKLKASI